jgi:hypothetical protein
MMSEEEIFRKSFKNLSAEEKEKFKELFQTEEEFENTQRLMQHLGKLDTREVIQPKPGMKDVLMAKFKEQKTAKPLPWYRRLKTFFILPNLALYRQPAFHIAMGMTVLLIVLLTIPFEKKQQLAENRLTQKPLSIQQSENSVSTLQNEENPPPPQEKMSLNQEETEKETAINIPSMAPSEMIKEKQTNTSAKQNRVTDDLGRVAVSEIPATNIVAFANRVEADDVVEKESVSKRKMLEGKNNSSTITFSAEDENLLDLLETAY